MKVSIKTICISFLIALFYLFLIAISSIAQEGQIVRETVHSPSLEGNLLGDSPDRQVTIYLPPSYDTEPDRRYPVVYLLHGYTGNNELWTGGSYISGDIRLSMKNWLNAGRVKEIILVMPNSYNRFRGSYYTNSVATGNWADFIAKDLLEYIDRHYRTLPQCESRAVIGHSMGGYGGMILGLDYPNIFGCMGSMSGLLDMTQYPVKVSWAYAQGAKLNKLSDFDSQSFDVQVAIAMSAAIVPNPNKPPFYADFAWEQDNSGKLVQNQQIWNRLLERDVLRRLSKDVDSLRNMKAIYIDCGTSDEFGLIVDAQRVHDELQRLDIPHHYREFAGDHTCCVMTSTGDALEVFSNAMAFEPVAEVKLKEKLATTWGKVKRAR